MPTVFRNGPFRFFFYAGDGGEPHHIHVERDDRVAKFWLVPVSEARSGGFSDRELGEIDRLVRDHLKELMEAWNDYFGP